ncbi:NACHT domain-containing protein [Podospora aff. communis PSN243]|uniref:NACHT domain-containing protein n=1 Tax=Podospora aff. communis PSN243 TaxID=3040156 RepID=A0AAV9G4B6_9PEZI|nr:NACHT domain-containing protein [Podospora aff. communis PSN243]
MSTASPASPPENGFQVALRKFEARLTPDERARCKVTTLDELKNVVLAIQDKQRKRREMINMRRIRGFLEAMEQFGKVIEVFTNTSEMVAFVWGPMKLLLLASFPTNKDATASCWMESLDALLDAYETIARNLPIFEGYQEQFRGNKRVQVVLESIWSSVLVFHLQALRIFDQHLLKQLFRSLWKDFKSRFNHLISDITQQKSTLESHVNQIHIQHYESDRLKMLAEFEHAQEKRAADKYMFVQQWINPESCIEYHEVHISVRQEQHKDTGHWLGDWILSNEHVRAWMVPGVPRASFLWINAIPGAGKSVLASVIIEDIKQKGLGPVAYFYCHHQDPNRRTFGSIAKGLLSQLIAQQRHLVPYYHDEAITSGEVSLQSQKRYRKPFKHMLQNITKAFLVIDGLDECPEKERIQFLDFLSETVSLCDNTQPGKVRVLVLSRDEPDLRKRLMIGLMAQLGRADFQGDITIYVKHRAERIYTKFSDHGLTIQDKEYIESHVLDMTEEMFLYAKLVMENLEGQPTIDHLRRELEPHRFPKGLGQAYSRTLDRIRNNPHPNDAAMAHRILSLMICCMRPLRWREIQAAISLNLETRTVESTRRTAVHIAEVCGSLIVQLQGDRIEFVHTTAVGYILEDGYISQFSADRAMASLCLLYLDFPCFAEDCSDDQRAQRVAEGCYSFQDYAIAHWPDHVSAVANRVDSTIPSQQPETPFRLEEDWMFDALLYFGFRYQVDIETATPTSAGSSPMPPGLAKFDTPRFSVLICLLWNHVRSVRARTGDSRDKVSLPSLENTLKANRQALEAVWGERSARSRRVVTIYGEKWFKCRQLSCYYFHEGFPSDTLRKDHYSRHDRPFRCEDEGCPGSIAGFASLNELEKHKRNMHPGFDRLSSTFARLKKGQGGNGREPKYPCPRPGCTQKFETRVDCRGHLMSHIQRILPKP